MRRSRRRAVVASLSTALVLGAVLGVGATGCATVDSPLPAQARPLPAPSTASPITAPPTTASPTTAFPTTDGRTGAPATDSPPPPAAPAAPSSSPSSPAECGDPRASLRPPAQLPAPGAMPAGSWMETIARRGYLTVGVLADVPPFGSISAFSGQFEGFDVDVAQEVGRAIFGTDGHVRFRAVTYDERIPVIRDDVVDLVVATMTTNCERRAQVDFSAVYYNESTRLLVLAGSPYHQLADLGGRQVCTAAGTTSIDTIVRSPSHPVPRVVPNIADCLVLLQAGAVDAITTTSAILAGMKDQDPRLEIVGPSLSDEPDAIAVSLKHPDLTRFVNGVLARMVADGGWDRSAAHWLSALRPPPVPPVPQYRD